MWKISAILLALATGALCQDHPLDEYVSRPDDSYSYFEISRQVNEDHTIFILNMTSQTWMTDEFSSQSVWWHYLTIIIPQEVSVPDAAGIFIGLGNQNNPPPDPDDNEFIPLLVDLALDIGGVTAMIENIPNQPIVFRDDPEQMSRSEDAIIAWTWAHFMNDTENRDTDVLLYMPMTKALVRTMDTITEFSNNENEELNIEKYLVTGPSKRGWTTYLTAAVDDRVFAMAPMVLSMLNIVPNLHHHYQSLGGWSWAFGDYWREGLTERLDSEDAALLIEMQDPFVFRDRYTMPKMLIKACNDEFFMTDDNQFYYDEFPGVKYHWLLQNSMHAMVGHYPRLVDNLASFFLMAYEEVDWPTFEFQTESSETSATTTMELDREPINVTVWYANTNNDDDRRDFRWLILGEDDDPQIQQGVRYFNDVDADNLGNNEYSVSFDAPESGWTAFFMTAFLPSPVDGRSVELSTDINIVPNTFGYEDCTGAECKGELK